MSTGPDCLHPMQEVLLSKDAEVEGLAEQRGALEEQLLDTLRNLLPILKVCFLVS